MLCWKNMVNGRKVIRFGTQEDVNITENSINAVINELIANKIVK